MPYIAGFTGNEPVKFKNIEIAKNYIFNEIEKELEQDTKSLSNEKFEQIKNALEYVENHPGPGLSVQVNEYVFWIEKEA